MTGDAVSAASGSSRPQTVVLAAGTCTGAGTTVALVEACRTLSEQVASGQIKSAEVRIPQGATEARKAAVGLTISERSRGAAIIEELFDRGTSDVYIGFADRLPLRPATSGTNIMVVQNPHLYESSDAPSLGGLGRKFLTAWADRSAKAADVIICATESSKQSVLDAVATLDSARIEVRPIRPETPAPRTDVADRISRILLLGDLYSYKRFDVALDGISQWVESTSSGVAQRLEVVHCGRAQDEEAKRTFDAAVGKLRASGVTVTTRGSVTHDEAMDELLVADLLISASEVETQGLTILEALAVGVPVVARAIGPVESIAGDAYQPFDVDGGAESVAEAIRSVEALARRQELVNAGVSKANMVVGWDLLPRGLSSDS